MPFVTEELWQRLPQQQAAGQGQADQRRSIMTQAYPKPNKVQSKALRTACGAVWTHVVVNCLRCCGGGPIAGWAKGGAAPCHAATRSCMLCRLQKKYLHFVP